MKRLWSAFIVLPVAGCVGVQSALDPRGLEADSIALLSWILFGVMAAVMALIVALTWLALRGRGRLREALAREGAVIAGGIVFPAVVLTGLLTYGIWLMRPVTAGDAGTVRIEVVGEQWWWRVTYLSEGTAFATANEVSIPTGRDVEVTLRSADVIHSFWVPSLAGKVDMIPGRTTRLRLHASVPGVSRGQCAEYCGGPHALMAFTVTAMPDAEFAAWSRREAAPARPPQSEAEQRGQDVFLAAGCGTCHTRRGTDAAGIIGPDLSHIGGRRSVGIDTLPLTAENLTRFVVAGQHVKPGNLMPEFAVLTAGERDALAAYLLSLR
jgi:cytochrome c oxidase subunit 2